MKKAGSFLLIILFIVLSASGFYSSLAAEAENKIRYINNNFNNDANFSPRPYKNAADVPLDTSFFIMLYVDGDKTEIIDADSVAIQLTPEDGESFYLINKNQEFGDGYFGEIKVIDHSSRGKVLSIYIDTVKKLKPSTKYTIKLEAKSQKGYGVMAQDSSWSFTTKSEQTIFDVNYTIDFDKESDVKWQGRHFNGIVRTEGSFDPDSIKYLDLIYNEETREKYPNAWDLFRYEISSHDIYNDSIIYGYRSNFVREKETRRIVSVTDEEDGVLLKLEDFFGHEQYGIESNRPLSGDYNVGDEILIHDRDNHRYATVISVNDQDNTILVTKFDQPQNGWLIDYLKPLRTEENPNAPGLFPIGGTYLNKFNPVGTPVYYWDRLDTILDLYVNKYGQRMSINICEAYLDLSVDGKRSTYPKDYAEFHKVTYDAVCHLIDRYGEQTTTWVWSIFNEPELWSLYWRSNDWIELQKFYDYAADAVLQAFEDKGYDPYDITIGGLELGAIFGANLKIHDFLAHCSPTAPKYSDYTLDYNAAYADPRLDGKRSRRTDDLCAANNGKGSPIDFVSIHAYNNSVMGAAKLIKAKEIALDIDPEYYEKLWVNNFETVPSWSGFEDPGFGDWTMGNGYFPSWTADFFGRLLNKSLEDPRYAYGESVLTIWGWPQNMFVPRNDVVFEVKVLKGRQIIKEYLPKPIYHYVNLVSTMNTNYWVMPQQTIDGYNISGFAASGNDDFRMVLYSHNYQDMQSRSGNTYNFNLDLKGLKWNNVKVTEYRFDKENNSYYSFAKDNINKNTLREKEFEELKELTELRITKESIYTVYNDGSLRLILPVAGNGVNFVILSDADAEETPQDESPTPAESEEPTEEPTDTPEDSPGDGTPAPPETEEPTATDEPTGEPSVEPTDKPSVEPTETGTPADTIQPSDTQTPVETKTPTEPNQPGGSPDTYDNGILLFIIFVALSGVVIFKEGLVLRKNGRQGNNR